MSSEVPATAEAFQDQYPEDVAVCYGCGRLNPRGLQIKSYWDGEETVCTFTPQPYHTAIPGYVYGGLIASLIDCHATGTASAATARSEGQPLADAKMPRFVTASLHVDYLKPTPLGPTIHLRAQVREAVGKKVVVDCSVVADGVETARGQVIAVQMPEHLLSRRGGEK